MNEPFSSSETQSKEILLSEILLNQQKILENQNLLLRFEKRRKIWGIVKIILIALLVLVPIFFLPMMMNSMMEGVLGGTSGGMNLDAILGNSDALEQLLMGNDVK